LWENHNSSVRICSSIVSLACFLYIPPSPFSSFHPSPLPPPPHTNLFFKFTATNPLLIQYHVFFILVTNTVLKHLRRGEIKKILKMEQNKIFHHMFRSLRTILRVKMLYLKELFMEKMAMFNSRQYP